MSMRFNCCQQEQIRLSSSREWVTTCGSTDAAAVLLWIDFGPYYLRRLLDIWSPMLSNYRLMIWYAGNNRRQMNRLALDPASVYECMIHNIHQLREQVSRRPVILVGHSFGSLFALPAAYRQPDLYHSYIGIGQCFNPAENDHSVYQRALKTAQSLGHQRMFQKLIKNGPPPYSRRRAGVYRLLYSYLEETAAHIRYRANPIRDKWPVWDNSCTPARGSARGKRSFFRRIYPALLNHGIDIQRLDIPAWFLSGRYDFMNAGGLTERYFNALDSPEKRLFWFEHSGHQLVRQEPEKCRDLLHQCLKAAARF